MFLQKKKKDDGGSLKKVTIIGGGLIGGSLARAIKANKLCGHVAVADISETACAEIKKIGFADTVHTDLAEAVQDADLIVLAIPVASTASVLKEISPALKAGAIVSDVGSTKEHAQNTMEELLPSHVQIVPAHPIAGTENSGPSAGFADLFQDKWLIVTRSSRASDVAIALVRSLWEGCGAKVEIMEAKHHDDVLAVTSHLPHLIAFSMMATAADLEDETQKEIIRFSASGFRDFTRVAGSDPTMWRDIFLQNRASMLPLLQRFFEDLTILQKLIRREDGDALFDYLERARTIRRNLK